MTEHKPMTYREIREYAEGEGWDLGDGGFERDLIKRRIAPSAYTSDNPIPWGVDQWLTHEVLPAINKTGHYDFPSHLDLICPHTYPLKEGRYATDPIE